MIKKGLGKGLGTLFEDDNELIDENSIMELKISQIEPNRNQPRKKFDKEKLAALSESIKENGLIQPIIVTKADDGRYIIVAGERRWRAAKLAGLSTVPSIVKEYTDKTVAEVALIENLQREDLNPIEEALGYRELSEKYYLKQEEISRIVGKSRSAIANAMRLLSLESEIQEKIISGEISEGHARAVLSLDGFDLRSFLVSQIIEGGLNVRQAEVLAKQLQKGRKENSKKKAAPNVYDIELERIQNRLSSNLGTKVTISHNDLKGKIQIEFYGNDDLDRILNLIEK